MVSSDEYLRFNIKSDDGTFNESININKLTVDEVKDIVAFLKETSDDDLTEFMFEIFVEFALDYCAKILNKNRGMIIELDGDE